MKWLKTEGFVSIDSKIPNSTFLIPNCASARKMAICWRGVPLMFGAYWQGKILGTVALQQSRKISLSGNSAADRR